MESLKFEISAINQTQMNQVKDVLNDLSNINNWNIAPYIDGYLVSIQGVNVLGYAIIKSFLELGVSAEQLYEE